MLLSVSRKDTMAQHNGKKLTSAKIKAVCGHEYRASILYVDEQDLNEQRTILSQMGCLDCIERKQTASDDANGQRKIARVQQRA